MTAEGYFGKVAPDDLYERAGVGESGRVYTPEALESLRERLFRTELVEIFMGGFLHDAGLWSNAIYEGHAERGALVVSEIPELHEIAEALLDIVYLHDDLEALSQSGGVIWSRNETDDKVTFEKDFYPTRLLSERGCGGRIYASPNRGHGAIGRGGEPSSGVAGCDRGVLSDVDGGTRREIRERGDR